MVRPDIVHPIQSEIEVTPKAVRSESIRAVRIILGRQHPPETGVSHTLMLPRARSEPSRR